MLRRSGSQTHTTTRRRRRGFTLVEFLVSSTLTVIVIVMATSSIAGGEKALTKNRNRDAAVLLSSEVLAKTSLLECGFGLLSAEISDVEQVNERARLIEERCSAEFTRNGETDTTFSAGDFTFTRGRYQVDFTTRWRQYGANADVCAAVVDTQTKTNSLAAAEKYQPTLLLVTVTVTWEEFGLERTYETYAARAVPNLGSYRDLGDGSIIVRADTGTDVTLSTNGQGVTRRADENGCAWFPYLAFGDGVGSYTYSTGGSGADVSLDSELPKVVS